MMNMERYKELKDMYRKVQNGEQFSETEKYDAGMFLEVTEFLENRYDAVHMELNETIHRLKENVSLSQFDDKKL